MYHNDNIENGMLVFWEKMVDEETGEYLGDRQIPACHCAECGKEIYEDDNCYSFPFVHGDKQTYILCEECIDGFVMYGKEAAKAEFNAAKRAREFYARIREIKAGHAI